MNIHSVRHEYGKGYLDMVVIGEDLTTTATGRIPSRLNDPHKFVELKRFLGSQLEDKEYFDQTHIKFKGW